MVTGPTPATAPTWNLINPATEETVDEIPFGDASDARLALDAADAAFGPWSHTNPYQRAKYLEKAAGIIRSRVDEFALVTTEESGKPFEQAKGEWLSCPNYFLWAAEECKRVYGRSIPARSSSRRIDVFYRPVGVVGLITAWNFPVYNQARAISSALAAGCTVVSRPSEFTPRSAMLIAQCLEEAGLPPGVLNLVNGRARTDRSGVPQRPPLSQDQLHRFHPGRKAADGRRLPHCDPIGPRAGRKRSGHHLSRRW